jgi:hypothetical protein
MLGRRSYIDNLWINLKYLILITSKFFSLLISLFIEHLTYTYVCVSLIRLVVFVIDIIFYHWMLIYRNWYTYTCTLVIASSFLFSFLFDVNLSQVYKEEPCCFWLTVTMFRWDIYIYISKPWSIKDFLLLLLLICFSCSLQ